MRARYGRTISSRRVVAVLGLVAALVAGCGSSGPTPSADLSSAAPTPATPSSSPTIVGAPGQSPTIAAIAPPSRVDFEANGDEINGWWWLRDAAGAQQASWGFSGIPANGPLELNLDLLATDAVTGAAGVDARFWLSYGAIVKDGVVSAPSGEPSLVVIPNTSPPGDPVGYTTTGTYTIARADVPAGAIGMWVRISRVGPGGAVLPAHLAVREASIRVAGVAGPAETPAPTVASPASADFTVNGDQINGWWWLRDAAGTQRASWAFSGTPMADQIRIDMNLLATDTINGGRGVDARFWLTYRTVVEGGGGGPLSEPRLVVLKNSSPPSDPVGYTTTGSYLIPSSEIAPGAIGLWVGISRVGPDGTVLSTHIAVQEMSVQVSGLGGGPAQTPAPSGGPSASASPAAETPAPTGSSLYGPLTITTDCQEYSAAPMAVSGSVAPDLHLEFSPTESFATVFANEEVFVLSPPAYTFESMYGTDSFPNGIWVRWAGAPSIKAYATNKGYCAGATPQPSVTPEPTPTLGPPSGAATIVALGDSYISGEAGRWAGNSYDWYGFTDAGGSGAYYDNASGTAETIAGCHRSGSAEVHIDRGGYGHVTTINLACSGATTQSRTSGDGDKPGVDRCPNDPYHDCAGDLSGQATLLEDTALHHNVKLVVLSIGGNDFEFSNTVVQCSTDFVESSYFYDTDYCNDDGSVLARFTSTNVSAVKTKLMNAYADIVAAMRAANYADSDWSLLVQTYPSPLPPGDSIRYPEFGLSRFTNGCPFWSPDANWANSTALPLINNTIKSAVAGFSSSYPAIDVHVMDVSQALNGHRLCENTVDQVGPLESVHTWSGSGASDGSEWVAQIRGVFSVGGKLPLPGSVYYKNESFHPNYWGQLALRDCLRQAYNNGNVRGGLCEFMDPGLNAFGEPKMILTQP